MGINTILIADDEFGFRYPLTIFLKNKGFNTIEAKDSTDVFENISKADILIMDVIFPDNREGIDIVKEIRQKEDKKIKNIPIIFYSILSEGMCTKELENIDKKSYFWLQKPFEFTDLLKAITELKWIYEEAYGFANVSCNRNGQ